MFLIHFLKLNLFTGDLSSRTEKLLELFTQKVANGLLLTQANNLIGAILNPTSISFVSKNLFVLYSQKEQNDCFGILKVGSISLQKLRKARDVLDFYYKTQLEGITCKCNKYFIVNRKKDTVIQWLRDGKKLLENSLQILKG